MHLRIDNEVGAAGAVRDRTSSDEGIALEELGSEDAERLRSTVLDVIASAVMVTRTDGTIIWVNEAFTRMSGYKFEEAVGQTPRALKSGVQDEAYYRRLWATVLAGRPWRGEVVERHKSGHLYTVLQSITPLLGDDGRPALFVAIHEDITELRGSQARLRAVFDNAADAIVLFDDAGGYVEANPAAHALVGYTEEEVATMSLATVVAAKDAERFAAGWEHFLTSGVQRGTYRLAHKDGRHVAVEYQAVAEIVPGIHLAIARDVTAEQEAQAGMRFQSQLLDAAGEAVIETDLDGYVHYWNAAAERLYGWTAQEALGQSILELNVDPGLGEQARAILATVELGETWSGEFEVRRRDGSTFPAFVTASPYVDEHGELAGIIGVSADISELTAARSALARRAAQQTVIGDLGRLALRTEGLDAVGLAAERIVAEGLGSGRWHATVVWDDLSQIELFGDASTGVIHVPIGESGALLVWDGGATDLPDDDREFLGGVASMLTVAQERETARAALDHLATHDPVTGLPNRTLLLDRIAHAIAEAQRTGDGLTLLFLDLDGFKLVNDGLGHHVGDELLRAVGRRLQGVVRPADTVARLGGDEFGILCPRLGDELAALGVALRVQAALELPIRIDGAEFAVTASIGAVLGDCASDGQRLLRDADTAMYRSKESGRNRVEIFDPAMHRRARQRLDRAGQLRKAIDEGEIEAHYQPIVSLDEERIAGLEVLARWRRRDGEIIMPDQFIPLAEETGLIEVLGAHILETACADMRVWAGLAPDLFVSVNVSARQFTRGGLAGTVRRALDTTGVEPCRLYLEITESALLTQRGVVATMRELRDYGVRFEVDDFGTGHSSLANLRRLPVDMLKIDRSFVGGLLADPRDRALVTAALDLADAFGLEAVAEGVETPEQRVLLTALGCELGQGFLWSPAVESGAVTALLGARLRTALSSRARIGPIRAP